MKLTHLRMSATALTVLAAGALVVVASSGTSSEQPPKSTSLLPYTLSNAVPVLHRDDTIEFLEADIAEIDSVQSIATSASGLVVSSGEHDSGGVTILNSSGEVTGQYESLKGIAISNPDGSTAAWVEQPTEGAPRRVVAASTTTGTVIDHLEVSDRTNVMALSAGVVALSDGDSSSLWTPGGGVQPLAFVPDDSYVVGLTESRVVAINDQTSTVYNRSTGSIIQSLPGVLAWDTATSTNELVGTNADGDVVVADLSTGVSRVINPPLEAAMARFGTDGSIVVADAETPSDDATPDIIATCTPTGDCTELETHSVPYIPDSGLGQILAQSY